MMNLAMRPASQKKKRTGFELSELAELYARRNFLADGSRPKDRTFAMTYDDLAKHYGCESEVVGNACILAADYARCGRIVRSQDGAWRFLPDALSDLEAAAVLGVTFMTIRRWAARGVLDLAPRGEGEARVMVTGRSVSEMIRDVRKRPKAGRPPKGGAA